LVLGIVVSLTTSLPFAPEAGVVLTFGSRLTRRRKSQAKEHTEMSRSRDSFVIVMK
jgi:hypothetical protein